MPFGNKIRMVGRKTSDQKRKCNLCSAIPFYIGGQLKQFCKPIYENIFKEFKKRKGNLCFHKFPKFFDDVFMPFRNSRFADAEVFPDRFHIIIFKIIQLDKHPFRLAKYTQTKPQFVQIHLMNNFK